MPRSRAGGRRNSVAVLPQAERRFAESGELWPAGCAAASGNLPQPGFPQHSLIFPGAEECAQALSGALLHALLFLTWWNAIAPLLNRDRGFFVNAANRAGEFRDCSNRREANHQK